MVNLSDIKNPSEHVTAYSRTMLCQRRGLNAWRVTPKVRGKASRLVEFVRDGRQWRLRCTELHSGRLCEANSFGRLCSHCWRVIRQLETNERRRQNRKLAA